MSDERHIIGVDLGGTKISAGIVIDGIVVKDTGTLLGKENLDNADNKNPQMGKAINAIFPDPVRATVKKIIAIDGIVVKDTGTLLGKENLDNADAIINIVIDTIADLFNEEIKGIGVGVPSIVDRKKGIIYDVVNIPSWKEVPLKSILESKFNVPVFIDNDVNCFAISEKLYGKGKKYENFVGLAIGTGIGGGIINRGRLLADANCGSGEFGEVLYKDARYEDYCSSLFFKNKYNTDGKILFKKAEKGDEKALKIFEEFGFHLGNAVKTVMFAVDPEAIIIGGSIAAAKEFYEKAMWKQIETFTFSRSVKKLKIEFLEETKHAPILGAAAVCLAHIIHEQDK